MSISFWSGFCARGFGYESRSRGLVFFGSGISIGKDPTDSERTAHQMELFSTIYELFSYPNPNKLDRADNFLYPDPPPGGGGEVLESGFAGYVPLASQNPHPIIVYSVANYRLHLSHIWANVIVLSRTEFNASRMLNIKTTAGTIFQLRTFLFLNPCLPEFSYPKNLENLRPHSSNSTKNVTPL